MKKHIPNILTCINVLSGCIACVMAFEGNYFWVIFWLIIAAVVDFFDGFSARLLKAYSSIGKDLDSLADMVSFGLAPAVLVFRFLSDSYVLKTLTFPFAEYIPYLSFMLVIFSALRLAKFNNDERQTKSFIGLPTPPNALFWISLCYGLNINTIGMPVQVSFYLILVLIVVFSLLMVSEIPMFSLKVENFGIKGNELRYLLIVLMIIAVIFGGLLGIAAGIIIYVLMSIVSSSLSQKQNKG